MPVLASDTGLVAFLLLLVGWLVRFFLFVVVVVVVLLLLLLLCDLEHQPRLSKKRKHSTK